MITKVQFEEFIMDHVDQDSELIELCEAELGNDPRLETLCTAWSDWTEHSSFSPVELFIYVIDYLRTIKENYDPETDSHIIKLIDSCINGLYTLMAAMNTFFKEVCYIALKRVKTTLNTIDFDYSQSFDDFIDSFYCSWEGIDEFWESDDIDKMDRTYLIGYISGYIEGYLKLIYEIRSSIIK